LDYDMNELSLKLPGNGWHDSTRHLLEVEAPDGSQVCLEVTRSAPIFAEELRAQLDAHLRERGRTMRGFELLGREEFGGGDVRGVSASYRSVTRDGGLHYECAYVPLKGALLIFTVTATVGHAAACRAVLVGAVESIQLRRGGA
jgi:hypothetical protein